MKKRAHRTKSFYYLGASHNTAKAFCLRAVNKIRRNISWNMAKEKPKVPSLNVGQQAFASLWDESDILLRLCVMLHTLWHKIGEKYTDLGILSTTLLPFRACVSSCLIYSKYILESDLDCNYFRSSGFLLGHALLAPGHSILFHSIHHCIRKQHNDSCFTSEASRTILSGVSDYQDFWKSNGMRSTPSYLFALLSYAKHK